MASLSFNKDNRIDDFTFVLVRKDNYKIGAIQGRNVDYKRNFNGPDELSLKVYKDLDSGYNKYWDRLNDYNDLYVPQLGKDGYFEIEVTLNEDNEGVYKTITATSRCESELSHVKIYNYEVNSDDEITYDEKWDENNVTRFYRRIPDEATEAEIQRLKHRSILHRLLDKLPNYSIGHVDQTLIDCTEWYQFSWDDTSVYDILSGDLSEQYHVLFKFDSENRIISAYDLYSVCQNDDCDYRQMMITDRNIFTRYRGDFHHVCPRCGSTNIKEGYGKFTKILVSRDNLTTSAQVSSNKDNLINCFKIASGDESMDAALVNQNPNGSGYIYQFSKDNMAEMPPELVQKLNEYNEEYDLWYYGDEDSGKGIYTFTKEETDGINDLINYCKNTFNKPVTDDFILMNASEQDGSSKYVGYQSLASLFYSIMDLEAFYTTSMVPDLQSSHLSIDDTVTKLLENNLEHISPISVYDPTTTSISSVESAIIQSAKCIINTAYYTVEIVNSSAKSQGDTTYTAPAKKDQEGIWTGKLRIKQIEYVGTADEQDYTRDTATLTIRVNNNAAGYATQRVNALVSRKDTSLMDLNSILYEELEEIKKAQDADETKLRNLATQYQNKLHEYSLDVLTDVVRPCFDDINDILIQNSDKINEIYALYQEHLGWIDAEIEAKQNTLNNIIIPVRQKIAGIFDSEGNIVTKGYRQITHDALDFEAFLGEELYKTFCNYRREDTYKNDNYISTDLDNSVIFQRAGELLDEAQKELYKASHLQFDVSGNLNNLLALPEFTPIKDDFEVGNWIKMSVDETIYDLRLLSYSINFEDLQNINVEFSTVEEIWSGASDIQSVLQAAGSIAGSYPNIQSQVKNHEESSKLVDNWVNEGMNATLTKFANDPVTQEVVYDSHGLLVRGYDDTTGEYLPQQIKIVKNGLYTTTDNWQTIDAGIGGFSYYDPEQQTIRDDGYGVVARTVVGQLILGENLAIYNEGGTFTANQDGLTLKNSSGDRVFYADTNGNLNVTGSIIATTLTATQNGYIGPWTFNNTSLYKAGGWKSSTAGSAYLGDEGISVTNKFYVDKTGKLTATGADIQGEIKVDTGRIGGTNGFTITTGKMYSGSHSAYNSNVDGVYVGTDYISLGKQGIIYFQNDGTGKIGPWMIDSTSIYKTNKTMGTAGAMYFGNNGLSVSNTFKVTSAGALTATGADITGAIKATSGQIGAANATNKITIGTNATHASIYYGMSSLGNTSNNGFYIGTDGIALGKGAFKVTAAGALTATSANIKGTIDATSMKAKDKYYIYMTSAASTGCIDGTVINNSGTDSSGAWRYHDNLGVKVGILDGYYASQGRKVSNILDGQGEKNFIYFNNSDTYEANNGATDNTWYINRKIIFYTDSINFNNAISSNYLKFTDERGIQTELGHNMLRYYNLAVAVGSSNEEMAFWSSNSSRHIQWKNTDYYFAASGSSDQRIKTNVSILSTSYEDLFMSIQPFSFNYLVGDDPNKHLGFMAQDVIKQMDKYGIDSSVYLTSIAKPSEEAQKYVTNGKLYRINYNEFIPFNTFMIQKNRKRIEQLEEQVVALKNIIKELKGE